MEKPFYSEQLGMWVVSSYSDVVDVLKRVDLFEPITSYEIMFRKLGMCSQAIEIMSTVFPLSTNRIATSSKPIHDKLKNAVKKSFSYKRIQSFEKEIERIAVNKLDTFSNATIIDLAEYSKQISLETILTFLGVPAEDFQYIHNLHNGMTRLFFAKLPEVEQIKSAQNFQDLKKYLSNLVDSSLIAAKSTVVFELLEAYQKPNSEITRAEMIQLLCDIISAGFDTTLHAMNWTLYRLISHQPSIWIGLESTAIDTIEQYVSETLRLNLAQMGLIRLAKSDTVLNNINIPKNAILYILHTYANRDAHIFSEPDKLKIRVEVSKQLTFGYGMHYCLGAQLAKSEIKISVKCLKERYPRLSLAENGIVFNNSSTMKIIKKFLVKTQ